MEDFLDFRTLISTATIKTVYVIGVIAIVVLGFLIIRGDGPNQDSNVVLGLSVIAFGNIFWRLFCESWILFHSIHENLVATRRVLERNATEIPLEVTEKVDVSQTSPIIPLHATSECSHEGQTGRFCTQCGVQLGVGD